MSVVTDLFAPLGISFQTDSGVIPQDAVIDVDGHATVSSQMVAHTFDKEHKHVLDAIRRLLAETGEWGMPNFRLTPYIAPQNGKTYDAYTLSRDAFMLLVMGYTGEKALRVKLAYIQRFNRMEQALRADACPQAELVLLRENAALKGQLLHAYEAELHRLKNPKRRRPLTPADREEIIRLTGLGWSAKRIGEKLGRAEGSVSGYLHHARRAGAQP